MTTATFHSPDQYMIELRQLLSQGRKRIGILVGAGAPLSIRVPIVGTAETRPLIPDLAGLTTQVNEKLDKSDRKILDSVSAIPPANPNLEHLLSRLRNFGDSLGGHKIAGLDGPKFADLADRICATIGSITDVELPHGPTPYARIAAWVTGANRSWPVEVFTPNYDLLFETAFERARVPLTLPPSTSPV